MVPKDECQLDVSELRTIFLSFDSLRYRILREVFIFVFVFDIFLFIN